MIPGISMLFSLIKNIKFVMLLLTLLGGYTLYTMYQSSPVKDMVEENFCSSGCKLH
jgi:hypothetical protein